MKDKLPKQKITKKFLFFNKNEGKPREFISEMKSIFFDYFIMIFSFSVSLFICWSALEIISLIPESEQHKKEVEERLVKQQLQAKFYEEALIKAKIKFFEKIVVMFSRLFIYF